MANINDLKNNDNSTVSIDLTNNTGNASTKLPQSQPNTKKPNLNNNNTGKTNTTTLKLNSIKVTNMNQPALVVETDDGNNNQVHNSKTVVKYDANKSVVNAHENKGNITHDKLRTTLKDIRRNEQEERTQLNISQVFPEKPDENIHESIEADILEGENSMFADFVRRKQQEMEEWVQQKEEEKAIKETEEESGVVIDSLTGDEEDVEINEDEDIKE